MAKLSVDQTLMRVKKHARNGEADEARRLLQGVLQAYPNNRRAQQALAGLNSMGAAATGGNPPQEVLAQLAGLFNEGQLASVSERAAKLVKQFPASPALWNMLGASSAETGQTEQAARAFGTVARLVPNSAEAHRNLGNILVIQGRFAEAVEACARALKLRPDYVEALNTLGNALKAQDRLDEAAAAYIRALKIRPDYAEVHYNLGNTLQEMKKHDKAVALYLKALKIKPDYAEAYYSMSVALLDLGQHEAAAEACTRALKLRPDHVETLNNLGNALRELDKSGEAVSIFEQALKIAPDYAESWNNMGVALQEQDLTDEAIAAFHRALKFNPNYAEALKNMGVALVADGKRPEALEAYTKALEIDPDYPEVHRSLSLITKYTEDEPHLARLAELYADDHIDDEGRLKICFALAKAFEDLGELEQAFAYLKEANALRRSLAPYEISSDEKRFAAIKQTADTLNGLAEKSAAAQTPIFILGMPRSGTTLVEQIVSSHSQVAGAGELQLAGRFGASLASGEVPPDEESLLAFRENYLAEIDQLAAGHGYVTDKMPQNFLYIGLIAAALPEAKIVHVKRDPAATCWSNFRQHFAVRGLGYSYDLGDVVSYYRLYEDLMRHWSDHYGERIYQLDYEALTTDQELGTRDLIGHLGLEWEDACLSPHLNTRAVKTASQSQVRKAVYSGSSQAWRKFEPYLDGAFEGFEG